MSTAAEDQQPASPRDVASNASRTESTEWRAALVVGLVAVLGCPIADLAMGQPVAPDWMRFSLASIGGLSFATALVQVKDATQMSKWTCGLWTVFGYTAAIWQIFEIFKH